MYLTNHSIATIIGTMLAPTASVSGPNSSSDYTIQLFTMIFTGVYVIATIVLVGITIWQSKASLAASAKQSQAAIDAVHEQIKASAKQSQAAIDAVHEQIEASEKQAQETIYNQFKPMIVPRNHPKSIANDDIAFAMQMLNIGAGVALNTWGIFYFKNSSEVYHFSKRYFLVPGSEALIFFNDGRDGIKAPSGEFHGHPTFLGPIPRIGDRGRSSGSMLMITYNDVFDNKYLVVFNDRDELGWEQIDLKRIGPHRLDELIETKIPVG